ncbi:MAG: hypothetical protein ACLQNE_42045 [Thermoguttaceae bacterium]
MKISEMENCHDEHAALEDRIRTMADNREFPAIFPVCVESFPQIVPAIKFRKQRGITPEIPKLQSFRIICKYAPPLFAHSFIEALLDFVKSTRLLAKHENGYLQAAEAALEREEMARMIWGHVARRPGALQRELRTTLGIDQDVAVELLETWEQLGVVVQQQETNSYRLYLRTQLDAEVEGRCPACGVHGKGRKELFLKTISCKRCGAEGYYHIQYANRQ